MDIVFQEIIYIKNDIKFFMIIDHVGDLQLINYL